MGLRAVVLLMLVSTPAAAVGQIDSAAARAFERYEAIRASLARDGLVDVAANAAALAPLAGALAGREAEAATQRGEAIENPYFGKVMLTCGVPYKNPR